MSDRPNWFRFVVATFVIALAFASILVSQDQAQELPIRLDSRGESSDSGVSGEKKELVEELFPYAHGKEPDGTASADLITASTYAYTFASGVSLEDMSSGTTNLVSGPGLDDTASPVTNIGFDFWYDGVRFSQFSVNVNGLARLGSTAVTTSFNNSTEGLNTVTNAPKIAPYFEDLCLGLTGKVHYKVVGSAPNRKLVVEWTGMQIPRNGTCTGFPASGTFQMWLFESAGSSNPGRIQFVYGGNVAPSTTDLGASIGLQAGVATNFASVTVSDDSVSYVTANNTNLPGVASGKTYIFTPNTTTAPSNLTFAPVTATSIQLNWSDNASNEAGYAIYRSTDGGASYSFLTQTAVDSVLFNDTGLVPGTTYFYRIHAATEGALSSALLGSQATTAAGEDSCAGAGGNWSDTAAWLDGSVPTINDNVTIGSSCTMTVDTAAAVALNVTINSGGILQKPAAGTTSNLTVGGNLTNNGTLDFGVAGDAAGATLTFAGPTVNATFGGTGAITDVRAVTINKGAAGTLELNPTNFTVLDVNTDTAGFLTHTSGMFKISGSFTMANRLYTAAAYTIPATGGLWINNPNFTVAGQNGSPTNNGVLRVTSGTFNVGNSSGNSMGGGAGAQFIVEGGTSNYAGRLQTTSAVSYTQSGGIVNVCTVGNAATTASFGLTSAANIFNMTGGSIVINLPNTNAAPLDYSVSTTATFVANPAGTTLQLGSGSTPPATTFRVTGATPSILINTGHLMAVGGGAGGAAVFMRGSTVTNNGAIVVQGTGASSRFDWAASGPMTYGGTGTFGTAGTTFTGVGMSSNGGDTTLNAPIFINRVNFFTGGFINSNQITLGNAGTSTTVVQVGNTTAATNAGSFDASPTYNTGSGGHTLLHLRTTTLNRTIGFEINPSRTLTQLAFDNNLPGATLATGAGDITIAGAATGSLALTNGVMIVPNANTIFHNAGTVTRTTGYVNGRISRSFAAIGAYTFHVGQGGYSPVAANVTAGAFPSTLSVKATQGPHPNFGTPSLALSRYWTLTEGGDLTADLTFNYLDPTDIPGTATEANFVIFKYDGTFTMPGGTVTPASNNAAITGVTSFSDWTLAEPGATATPGTLQFSAPTYSVGEAGPTATITVTRTGGTDGAVSVDYASVAGGTATGGASCAGSVDYVNAVGTLNWANGDGANKTFSVTICDDPTDEPDETVNLALSNPMGGATVGSQSTSVLTITDNDVSGAACEMPSIGNIEVQATAGTMGPSGYATLGAAFSAINTNIHQGVITIDVCGDTTEAATASLTASGAGGTYTSILIAPVGGQRIIEGSIVGAIIRLNGADNVTIDGRLGGTGTSRDLTVRNNSSTTATAAIWLSSVAAGNGASNNTIRNLEIAAGAPQNTGALNTFGILMNGATIAVGTNGDDNDNNSFIANRIIRARYGIATRGNPTNVNLNTVVTDNIIGPAAFGADQIGKVGIFMQADDGATIGRNTIQFVGGAFANTTAGADRIGIALGVESWGSAPTTLAGANYNVTRNVIHDVIEERTFSAVGILQASANGANPTSNLIANNFIYNVNANGTVGDTAIGIGIASGNNDRVVFNSVRMAGDSDPSAGAATPTQNPMNLRVANTPANLTVKNNSLYNDVFSSSAPALQSANIQLPTATFAFGTGGLNNNNYYFPVSNTTARTGAIGTTSVPTAFHQTLANWQAAVTPQDANSIQADPQYVSATDLHIALGSPNVNAGATGTGVPVDIDFQARDAMPDIGADEPNGATPPANDIAAVTIVNPAPGANLVIGNTATPQAKFYNAGSATQTGVMVQFTITGPGSYNYSDIKSIASIDPDAVTTVTFATTSPFTTPGAYVTTATVLTPDSNPSNDSVTAGFNVLSPLSGTITVGTGGAFTSLTNPGGVFEALNLAGTSGNLTVNITSDLTAETGAVALNQIAESGAGGYTVTIKPSGAPRIVSGTSAANSGLIILHGADRIVFDGSLSGGTDRSLTLTNNQATGGIVIWVRSPNASNGATNNTIKNCILNGAPGPNSTTVAGVLSGSSVTLGGDAEAPNSNNTIQNNWIYRVQNSAYLRGGLTAPVFDQNWTVVGNEFGSTNTNDKNIFRGMLIGNSANFTVSGNTVHGIRSTATTGAAMSGIQLALLLSNGTVTNNQVSDIKNVSATGTGAHGISIIATSTGSNVTIANNFVSDIAANGSATVASNGHGIAFLSTAAGSGYNLYFNSVSLGTNQTTAQTTAGLFVTTTFNAAGAINLRNNILSNTETTGTRYAVYSLAPATVFSTINYNDYFAQNVGFIGGTARATLADWQTATGQDANSKSVDPIFVSATDLHLQPTSTLLGMAVFGTGITTDIDGQTRDNPPDIGADELLAGATPGSLQFSSATYSVGEAGGTVTLTVTRTGGSGGVVGVNYATANGTATGGASCTAGIDYVNANGTLTWSDGDTASKTFNVTICNDATFEPDETFTATLSGATGGATIGTPNPATVTITNDDPPPPGGFSINDVRLFEGNSGAVNAVFTVTFNGAGAASVQYATANGTAIAGTDYLPASGTLNFNSSFEPEGGVPTSTQTITVVVNGEVVKEANETFFVNLSNPIGGSIGDGQGVAIIVDEDRAYVADFDRDLSSDASVYRPSDGKWYVLRSASASAQVVTFGLATDVAVPGDYDGDGLADFGVWRPSTGQWFRILSASASTVITSWGSPGDKPVQGDYDGDGKTDLAIYRSSTGTWWILRSSDGTSTAIPFGISTDRPMQGDYDGDAKTDLAVYRDGTWYVSQSSDSAVTIRNWGLASDKPVSGDFDGDGKYDLAVFRSGVWWISNSLTGSTSIVALGAATDIPAPADYDGDGTTDKATFRPSNGDWYILRSSNGTVMGPHWGVSGDVPVPSAYVPQ